MQKSALKWHGVVQRFSSNPTHPVDVWTSDRLPQLRLAPCRANPGATPVIAITKYNSGRQTLFNGPFGWIRCLPAPWLDAD